MNWKNKKNLRLCLKTKAIFLLKITKINFFVKIFENVYSEQLNVNLKNILSVLLSASKALGLWTCFNKAYRGL